jgi:hypothetical protein
MNRLLFALIFAAGAFFAAAPRAPREGETDVFARVVVAETEMRAGPGISYRVIPSRPARRPFLIEDARNSGYWLEVLLPDGRTAYVLGDTVEAVAVDEEAPTRRASRASSRRPRLRGCARRARADGRRVGTASATRRRARAR